MSGFKKGHKPVRRHTLKRKHSPVLKKLAIAFAIVLVAIALYVKVQPYTQEAKTRTKLESTSQQLKKTQSELQLEQTQSKQQFDEQQKKLQEVNQKLEETEKALQAKRSTPKVYAAERAIPAYAPSGDKDAWLTASGIPVSEWWAVDWIVSRESGWKPCAYNPGRNDCNANPSSACGLVQQYPCHKIPGDWRDPVVALKWQYQYVTARYGGYAQAVAYWQIHHNY